MKLLGRLVELHEVDGEALRHPQLPVDRVDGRRGARSSAQQLLPSSQPLPESGGPITTGSRSTGAKRATCLGERRRQQRRARLGQRDRDGVVDGRGDVVVAVDDGVHEHERTLTRRQRRRADCTAERPHDRPSGASPSSVCTAVSPAIAATESIVISVETTLVSCSSHARWTLPSVDSAGTGVARMSATTGVSTSFGRAGLRLARRCRTTRRRVVARPGASWSARRPRARPSSPAPPWSKAPCRPCRRCTHSCRPPGPPPRPFPSRTVPPSSSLPSGGPPAAQRSSRRNQLSALYCVIRRVGLLGRSRQ